MKQKVLICCILLYPLYLCARQDIDFQGFATAGAVYNGDRDYIYRKDAFAKDGSSGDVAYDTDTLIGGQVVCNVTDRVSLIAQAVVRNDYDDTYSPFLDWAYLNYHAAQNLQIKAGRIRTPYFKNSDTLHIGYANLMIREPVEVYGQVPFSSFNGIELLYGSNIGEYFYSVQLDIGQEELDVPFHSMGEVASVEIDNILGGNISFGTQRLWLRATYLQADITASNKTLDNIFGSVDAQTYQKYALDDRYSRYWGFGLFGEYHSFLYAAEYGRRINQSFYTDLKGWYARLGYKMDRLIVYGVYADTEPTQQTYGADSGYAPLDSLLAIQNLQQKSYTAGMKYFVSDNTDIKLQYERVKPEGPLGSYHLHINSNTDAFDVFSVAVDFVF